MTQPDLLSWTPPEPKGMTYIPDRDGERLSRQARRVFLIMRDGDWHALHELAIKTGDPEASISARLRDLRRAGYMVLRQYVERGLWRYRMEPR